MGAGARTLKRAAGRRRLLGRLGAGALLLAADATGTTAAVAAAAAAAAAGAKATSGGSVDGRWPGALEPDEAAVGHRLREAPADDGSVPGSPPGVSPGDAPRRCSVLIVGAGIGGLAAARALRRAGIDDFVLLELAQAPGGNSRGAQVDGLDCAAGAHYLPLPGEQATEVADLLGELGVRDRDGAYDERMLIHSPQERLFIHGVWQEGLLPLVGQDAATFDDYRRFAERIAALRAQGGFAIPQARAPRPAQAQLLERTTFAAWLDAEGLSTPGLRWYLDYCCRDDYGAGSARVSAWAGLHYFASRHGFQLPSVLQPSRAGERAVERESMLTWPQGNGWLVDRLAGPLAGRLSTGCLVQRIRREGTRWRVDARDVAAGGARTWLTDAVVWAAPAFVAARVVADPAIDPGLAAAAAAIEHAPWLVANVLVDERWKPRGTSPLAWDNVIHDSPSLGYVNARHQRLDRRGGPTLLTWYRALGDEAGARRRLAGASFDTLAGEVVADLGRAHPEIGRFVRRVAIRRWGHAMPVPTPALHRSGALAFLQREHGRLWFAHSDCSGYSIFEEAFHWGHRAGVAAARTVRGA